MSKVTDYPLLVFALSAFLLWLSVRIGLAASKRRRELGAELSEDYGVIQGATLTLLALIIGFSFSMAIGRYDQRKNYEEEEANAIGTEYLRADLLPAANAAKTRALLRAYLDQRVPFYQTRDAQKLEQINAETARLQAELWSSVRDPAVAQPTAVNALVAAGMNDVINTQGYTQAAWWNRIPVAAWIMMIAIAICGNLMIGYGARSLGASRMLQLILPLVLALSFLLIADIDSPRGGLIRVQPMNLITLSESLRTH